MKPKPSLHSKTLCHAAMLCATAQLAIAADPDWITYEPKPGPGGGRNVVLLAGDEEYRSEEALPMLGKILSQHHGFKCTVLFSVDTNGTINPKRSDSLSHPEALDSADAIVMLLRYRRWSDATMRKFDAAMKRGVPIVALRTSTHAFNGLARGGEWESWNSINGGWGKRVLGETWVSHWGRHKFEATRGAIEPEAANQPLVRGVSDIFVETDVYEAHPPPDAKIVLRGIVLKGMNPEDAPADYLKRRLPDRGEQPINQPAMPVAWTREVTNSAGTVNRVFCTTMGAASDLKNESLRRLVVNAVFWGLKMDVPARTNVDPVDPYEPLMYGFDTFRQGIKAADHAVGKKLRAGDPAR